MQALKSFSKSFLLFTFLLLFLPVLFTPSKVLSSKVFTFCPVLSLTFKGLKPTFTFSSSFILTFKSLKLKSLYFLLVLSLTFKNLKPTLSHSDLIQVSKTALAEMSRLSALLSEARNTADEASQDEQDFVQVRNKRKRTRNLPKTNSETIRPVIVTVNPRPTQVHFARSMRNSFPHIKISRIRELPNNNDFFIQPEDQISRECLMNTSNLQLVFPNTSVNARNTLPKAKTKPSFVIVNVHHSIQENEVKEELLNNNAMNVIKVLRITSRANGKPTKLIRVITDCSNHVKAAIKHGVKIGWVLHRCEPSKEPPHIKQCFKCQKFGHSASDCKDELRCLRCAGKHTVKKLQ